MSDKNLTVLPPNHDQTVSVIHIMVSLLRKIDRLERLVLNLVEDFQDTQGAENLLNEMNRENRVSFTPCTQSFIEMAEKMLNEELNRDGQ